MIFSDAETEVRRILRDTPSDVRKGTFWSSNEINMFLRISQDMFFNYCLDNIIPIPLSHLVTRATLTSTDPVFMVPLPDGYCSGISATLFVPVTEGDPFPVPARIYTNQATDIMKRINHDAACIQNGNITFMLSSNTASMLNPGIHNNSPFAVSPKKAELVYYRYPNWSDFEDNIHRLVFIPLAAYLLGLKEPQTQREYKLFVNVKERLATLARQLPGIVELSDMPVQLRPQQKGEG